MPRINKRVIKVKAWAVIVYGDLISAYTGDDSAAGTTAMAIFKDYKDAEEFAPTLDEQFTDIIEVTLSYSLPSGSSRKK